MIGWDLRSRPVAVKRALGWTATDGSVDPVAERCSIGVLVLVLDLRLHLTLPQSSLSAREPKGERERERVCGERERERCLSTIESSTIVIVHDLRPSRLPPQIWASGLHRNERQSKRTFGDVRSVREYLVSIEWERLGDWIEEKT